MKTLTKHNNYMFHIIFIEGLFVGVYLLVHGSQTHPATQ